jgi:hypothetical protein
VRIVTKAGSPSSGREAPTKSGRPHRPWWSAMINFVLDAATAAIAAGATVRVRKDLFRP